MRAEAFEENVVKPGGELPGNPEIALVKVADGLVDPVAALAAIPKLLPVDAKARAELLGPGGATAVRVLETTAGLALELPATPPDVLLPCVVLHFADDWGEQRRLMVRPEQQVLLSFWSKNRIENTGKIDL